MNKLKWILLLICLPCLAGNLYSQCSFEKYFPYSKIGFLNIYKTSDNFIIVIADGTPVEIDPINGQSNMIIIKMDTCGNVLWKIEYGDPIQNDKLSGGFNETENGDYIFIGDAIYQAKELNNIRILKTNKEGKILDSKLFEKYEAGATMFVKNSSKKNSYYVGGFNVRNGVYNEAYLMEIDEDGNIIRDKIFAYPTVKSGRKYVRKLLQLNSNTFYTFVALGDSLLVSNIDSNFNIRWTRQAAPNDIIRLQYLDACFSYDSLSITILGDFDLYDNNNNYRSNYIKTDLELNTQKLEGIKQQVSINQPIFIKPTPDNGYITNNSVTYLDSNLNITKIDSFYISDGPTFFWFWVPNGNKSVYGVAAAGKETDIYAKLLVAKTDQDGRVNIIEPKPTLPLKIYPNPAKDILNIEICEEGKTYKVEIIDMLSKTILTQNIIGTSTINIENLVNGFYSVNLTDNTGKVNTCKLFISK
jgi:hypothetical protein